MEETATISLERYDSLLRKENELEALKKESKSAFGEAGKEAKAFSFEKDKLERDLIKKDCVIRIREADIQILINENRTLVSEIRRASRMSRSEFKKWKEYVFDISVLEIPYPYF